MRRKHYRYMEEERLILNKTLTECTIRDSKIEAFKYYKRRVEVGSEFEDLSRNRELVT